MKNKKGNDLIDHPVLRKSLDNSVKDGIFASGMIGFTQDFFTPFLLLMGGTSGHVGLLSSVPNFLGALLQLKCPDLALRVGSRKKFITFFVFLQAMLLIPMGLMAVFFVKQPLVLILFVALFAAAGAFVMPVWGSLMSDHVGENKRGEYFGWRNKVLGIVMIASAFIAGIVLHTLEEWNVFYGFAVLFFIAALLRLISWHYLTQMYEPLLEHKKEDYFSFWMFLKRIKQSNFAKFVIFVSSLNFCVNMAAPFFSVYMLQDLHFNYFIYTMINITVAISVYFLMSRWGKHADKVGNIKVLKFCAPIISTLPLYWIFCQHPLYLMLVQVLSGFAWAGFHLSASNFIYDAVSPSKRMRCIAYFNVLNGMGICLGAIVGGYLMNYLPPLWGNKFFALFAFSSALRLPVALFLPRLLKEVRSVEKIPSHQLFFSMVGIKPMIGVDRKTLQYGSEA